MRFDWKTIFQLCLSSDKIIFDLDMEYKIEIHQFSEKSFESVLQKNIHSRKLLGEIFFKSNFKNFDIGIQIQIVCFDIILI